MNADEIKNTIEKHQLWLNDQGGERADLIGANLSGADLSEANLRGANLCGANLRGANLIGANLRGADLREADLSGADLIGADLSRANLGYAKFFGANLRGADLSEANLRGANLCGANLRGANLIGANLSGANLIYAKGPIVSVHRDLAKSILNQLEAQPGCLNMASWHSCETTHCLAGWAVTLHPQGKLLESMIGPNAAGALIFNACCGEVPDFFPNEEEAAVNWLRSKAKETNE